MSLAERLLEKYPEAPRPDAVTAALLELRNRQDKMETVVCELAAEAHAKGYWSQVRREDGGPYLTEEAYFEAALHIASHRSAAKRIAIGRAIAEAPEGTRDLVRDGVTRVGIAKAAILVPVLVAQGKYGDARWWFDRAESFSAGELQRAVSEAVGAKRRQATKGAAFRDWLLERMPDLDARAVVEEVLALGARVAETEDALGIVLAAFRESIASWAPAVAAMPPLPEEDPDGTGDPASSTSDGADDPQGPHDGDGAGGGHPGGDAGPTGRPRRRRSGTATRRRGVSP